MQTAAKTQMTNLETIKGAIAAKLDNASFTSWIAPLSFDVVDGIMGMGDFVVSGIYVYYEVCWCDVN